MKDKASVNSTEILQILLLLKTTTTTRNWSGNSTTTSDRRKQTACEIHVQQTTTRNGRKYRKPHNAATRECEILTIEPLNSWYKQPRITTLSRKAYRGGGHLTGSSFLNSLLRNFNIFPQLFLFPPPECWYFPSILLFSLLNVIIPSFTILSFSLLLLISIVFLPPPPHFYCFPSSTSSFLLFLLEKAKEAKIRPIRPNSNVMVWSEEWRRENNRNEEEEEEGK